MSLTLLSHSQAEESLLVSSADAVYSLDLSLLTSYATEQALHVSQPVNSVSAPSLVRAGPHHEAQKEEQPRWAPGSVLFQVRSRRDTAAAAEELESSGSDSNTPYDDPDRSAPSRSSSPASLWKKVGKAVLSPIRAAKSHRKSEESWGSLDMALRHRRQRSIRRLRVGVPEFSNSPSTLTPLGSGQWSFGSPGSLPAAALPQQPLRLNQRSFSVDDAARGPSASRATGVSTQQFRQRGTAPSPTLVRDWEPYLESIILQARGRRRSLSSALPAVTAAASDGGW